MNLQTIIAGLPLWQWLALAVLAFVAKRKGWLDGLLKPSPPAGNDAQPSAKASSDAAPQVVELRHFVGASPPAGSDAANPLTQTRRVNVGLDVAVTPVAEPPK